MEAKALWHISEISSDLKEVGLAHNPKHCLVKSLYSLISLGTEKTVAKGRVPASIFSEMQVPFMQGSFDFPLTYGYSLIGKVIDGPKEYLDRNVHVLHPHQDIVEVSPDDLYFLPPGIDLKIASLASNMETAINAVWDGNVSIGDKVLIVGFGLIGALVGTILKNIPGLDLTIVEKNDHRIALAKELGFRVLGETDLLRNDFDLSFNASNSESGLQLCIDSVDREGRIIELSWFGDKSVSLRLGHDFHSKRKQIISSQVSQIPGDKQSRWDVLRRKHLVFELLKLKGIESLITQEIHFNSSPEFFNEIRNSTINDLGVVIKY
ncbi:zinc-binding alcohol dehydrogenase [Fulvivirgaceae bacterium BMA10]|uniref:Zinc-binding alcohol dehydrogenase n=1 Tax=Splendidivirga corallicola TaxID=3051826 RepID=A0ABT8KPJ1_9BACT|nr:zinc-binding alcohol dehydrogenase [Fulvivirgaceae bacterium BMA10]